MRNSECGMRNGKAGKMLRKAAIRFLINCLIGTSVLYAGDLTIMERQMWNEFENSVAEEEMWAGLDDQLGNDEADSIILKITLVCVAIGLGQIVFNMIFAASGGYGPYI